MTRRRSRLVPVAVLTLALVMGACGDDDDDDAVTASTAAAATTTTSTSVAANSTAAVTIDCPTVGFTPQSEDAASSVKATGVSCDEAETFLRAAGPRTSSGGPNTLEVDGYRCVMTKQVEDPLPQAFYECENGAKRISFVRS
jgi:hypothetical protein